MSQFSFEQKIEIVSKMALDYCNENGLKFKQYNQKFAELIVKECISCLNDGAKQAGDVRTTVGTVEKTLKQHFGLET